MGGDVNVLMVLANHDFRDEEYLETYEALFSAGIGVKIAALSNEDCVGISGTTVSTDFTLDEVSVDQFDGIVFIGGVGIEGYIHDESIHNVVRAFFSADKLVAAICWAPAILAQAGVLTGKKATGWSGAKNDLEKGSATYTGETITVDGKIITADGPDSAMAFGNELVKILAG